jgi:hypothetical protein
MDRSEPSAVVVAVPDFTDPVLQKPTPLHRAD